MCLGHLAVAIVAHDLQLVHRIFLLTEVAQEFVAENPPERHPDVFMHRRAHRSDHPALAVAAAHFSAHGFCIGAVPKLIPGLGIKVTHHLLVTRAVAGHHVAVGIDEKGIETHITGKQPLLTVDVIDQPVVKVGAEPFLGAARLQQFVDEGFEVAGDHRTVADDVLRFDEIETVVQRCGRELHPQPVGNQIERHEVCGIAVLYGHAEAHVLHSHLHKFAERGIAAVEPVLQAADFVVRLLQTLYADADADLREFPAEVDDAVRKETVGADDDAVRMPVEFAHDVLEVFPDKGLSPRDVGKVHPGELLYRIDGNLLLRLRRRLVSVAHRTARITAIGDDDRSVEFLGWHTQSVLCEDNKIQRLDK